MTLAVTRSGVLMQQDARGGEMTSSDEWYINMAGAMQRRNHAMAMKQRWQEKIDTAEQEIETLRAEQVDTTTEQVPE